jgi:phage terminase large subunit
LIYKRFFEAAGVETGFNGIKGNTTYIHTTYLDNINNLDQSFIDEVKNIEVSNL